MDQNRDWKPVAALVLAALALFVALGGARDRGNDQVSAVPQQIIVQPAAPSTGQTGGAVAPQIVLPAPPADVTHAWGGWAGGGPGWPWAYLPHLPTALARRLSPAGVQSSGTQALRRRARLVWQAMGPRPRSRTAGATAGPALRALSAIPAVSAGLRARPTLQWRLLSAGAAASAATAEPTPSAERPC